MIYCDTKWHPTQKRFIAYEYPELPTVCIKNFDDGSYKFALVSGSKISSQVRYSKEPQRFISQLWSKEHACRYQFDDAMFFTKFPFRSVLATGNVFGDLALDANQNIYACGTRVNDKSVFKFSADGEQIWSYDTGNRANAVAIDPTTGNILVCGVEADGKATWRLDADNGDLIDSYTFGNDKRDIAVDAAGNLYLVGVAVNSFDSAGSSRWSYSAGFSIGNNRLALDSLGNVYASGMWSNYGKVVKLTNAGASVWGKSVKNMYVWSLGVDSGGNVYCGGRYNDESCSAWNYDTDGNYQWKYETGDNVLGLAVDSSDRVILVGNVGDDGKTMWMLDDSGNLLDSYLIDISPSVITAI